MSLIFGGGVICSGVGRVILFYVLHVIGFVVMAQAWGVGRGDLLQSWGTAQASGGGEIIGGVRPQGVGSSGEWGRVAPGPEPQQIGEHVQGVHHLNNVPTCVRVCRCAGVWECAGLRACADVQGWGNVQMCRASDVQGWGNVQSFGRVQGFGSVQMCKGLEVCRTSGVGRCAGVRECANV